MWIPEGVRESLRGEVIRGCGGEWIYGEGCDTSSSPAAEKKLVVMTTENIGQGLSIGSGAQNYVSIAGGWDSLEVPCTMGKTALSRTDSCGIWARPFVAGSILGHCGYLVLVLEHIHTVNGIHFQSRSLSKSIEPLCPISWSCKLGHFIVDIQLPLHQDHPTKNTRMASLGSNISPSVAVEAKVRLPRPCDAGIQGSPASPRDRPHHPTPAPKHWSTHKSTVSRWHR